MVIRHAHLNDFFQVRHLISLDLNHSKDFVALTPHEIKPLTIQAYKKLMADATILILIAEENHQIQGLCIAQKHDAPPENLTFNHFEYVSLNVLCVNSAHENNVETKKKLIQEVKNWGTQIGVYDLEIKIYAPNDDADFLHQIGFQPYYHCLRMNIQEKPTVPSIFHITSSSKWEKANTIGLYQHESLQSEGFIHCCTENQIEDVVRLYDEKLVDLVLLEINPNALQAKLKYETVATEEFPHLYGSLNLDAVICVYDLDIH